MWGATRPSAVSSQHGHFNPRSPCGERRHANAGAVLQHISIHAPRVGSDTYACSGCGRLSYFNPRSPCGERHFASLARNSSMLFQSTLPVWGATLIMRYSVSPCTISIHAPRVGSDESDLSWHELIDISIHAPRVGSDCALRAITPSIRNFNPRSPCGERPSASLT